MKATRPPRRRRASKYCMDLGAGYTAARDQLASRAADALGSVSAARHPRADAHGPNARTLAVAEHVALAAFRRRIGRRRARS